jgi:hypothetical protein
MNDKSLRVLASIGLGVGGALGLAGSFAPSAPLRGLAWGIDGTALVMACPKLTPRCSHFSSRPGITCGVG